MQAGGVSQRTTVEDASARGVDGREKKLVFPVGFLDFTEWFSEMAAVFDLWY